ncbi:MAG: biotin/lipoyl-binding protein, partial [Candidatus Baltobacteraceae bacterium]
MSAQSLPVSSGLAGVVPALRGTPRIVAILAGIAIAALSVAAWLSHARSEPQVTTEPVARQTLTQSVTASGTVNAQNTIAVGTQISGTIAALNVDFNSKVRKGQVLARLDPSTMQAQLDQASAALAQTQAQADAAGADAGGANASVDVASANTAAQQAAVASAQANAAKAQDAVVLARAQFDRDNALYTQGFLAQATMQADRSNLTQSQAAAAAAEAAVAQARAQAVAGNATIVQSASQAQGQAATAQAAQASVAAARAIREEDQLNLDRTVITSPVDGTV